MIINSPTLTIPSSSLFSIPSALPKRPSARFSNTLFFKSPRCSYLCISSLSLSSDNRIPLVTRNDVVSDRLLFLASEFRCLMEPIDRVKRLLHYAAVLPAFDPAARIPENKASGCTTQVWVEAKMDDYGRLRFRADSDSEITKGFCSCLVWLLDGAEPEEVLAIRAEDLGDMNVGLYGKENSRVNVWGNVLVAMQKRTEVLVCERLRIQTLPLERFRFLVASLEDNCGGDVCNEKARFYTSV